MERLAKLLNEKSHMKILDVGTGTGNFIGLLTSCTNQFDTIIGIDKIDGALKIAKDQFQDERIQFLKMDGYHLDFPDQWFDVVCLSNSLHHLEQIELLFIEMQRVLKQDGVLLIAEMINNDLTKKQISHLKLHHFAAKVDRLLGETHNETYSERDILELLSDQKHIKVQTFWKLNILGQPNEELNEKWFKDTIQRLLNRLPNEIREDLVLEGNEITEYIKTNGFDTCPTLIVVMNNETVKDI